MSLESLNAYRKLLMGVPNDNPDIDQFKVAQVIVDVSGICTRIVIGKLNFTYIENTKRKRPKFKNVQFIPLDC